MGLIFEHAVDMQHFIIMLPQAGEESENTQGCFYQTINKNSLNFQPHFGLRI